MSAFFVLTSMLGFVVFVILFIVAAIRKRPKKTFGIVTGVCFLVFIVSAVATGSTTDTSDASTANRAVLSAESSDMEKPKEETTPKAEKVKAEKATKEKAAKAKAEKEASEKAKREKAAKEKAEKEAKEKKKAEREKAAKKKAEKKAAEKKAQQKKAANEKTEQGKGENPDLAMITASGHPALYGSTKQAHKVWDYASGNKVVFADSYKKYSEDTIITMEGYSIGEDNEIIRKIEVYFQNFSTPKAISLDHAQKIAKEYLPIEIVNRWYEFSESYCYKPVDAKSDKDAYFVISYTLSDEGSEAYDAHDHSYSGSIDFIFCGADKDRIDYFTVGFGTPRWMGAAEQNGYEKQDWECKF